jgi:signal transduction histidine kinase
MHPQKKPYTYLFHLPAILLATLLLSGCFERESAGDKTLKAQLRLADSMYYVKEGTEALTLLKSLRPKLTGKTKLLLNYYYLRAQHHAYTLGEMDIYADSSLALLKSSEAIKKYPDEYYRSLLSKSDVCLKQGKFVTALDYFDKAKQALPQSSFCDDGSIAGRTASIYYGQKNFKLAARALLENYIKQKYCDTKATLQEQFFLQAGALDNIGLSYQQAGMLDSADYYYRQDLAVITAAIRNKIVPKRNTDASLAVLYDNLGGLNLKRGNLKAANYYLTSSLAIPDPESDGSRIPPLVKYAELQIKQSNYSQAYQALTHSRKLLNKYMDANTESAMRWDQVYALYLSKTNKPDSAYYYLNLYINHKRFIDSSSTELNRLNVQREIAGIQQQQFLNNLSQRDKVKKLYLVGFAVIALLAIIIIYLVYRNLKKARKSNNVAVLQNQQLQQTLSELERVNKNYIRIMRVMAHDLRNPLSGMIGLATLLLSEEDDFSDETRHMLQLIESTGLHSIEMINELLKTGLADENEQVIKQDLDIRSLLYDSVELLQFKAKEKGQQIVFEGDDTPIIVQASHEKIWRVFNNLIVNAIKFSHTGGIIKVNITADKKHVTIAVADNGIGIPPEHKDSIFEMFTPAKKTGTNGEQPFGLGLSISKRIIESHGGKIWFESTAGAGTTFFVELPR